MLRPDFLFRLVIVHCGGEIGKDIRTEFEEPQRTKLNVRLVCRRRVHSPPELLCYDAG